MGAATGAVLQAAKPNTQVAASAARLNKMGRLTVLINGGFRFLKGVNRPKNNDRIAVNLRRVLASFWIDVRGQEVKAKRSFAPPRAASLRWSPAWTTA